MLYVFDIDGTLANGEIRFKLAGPEPLRSDKEAYTKWVELVNTGVHNDVPVPGMDVLCDALYQHDCIYLTSREEKLRVVTQEWLINNGFPVGIDLKMRPNDCWDDAADLKERIIKETLGANQSAIVFDDDEHGTIEAMCKKNGYTFFKARSGGQK